jgi:hypothetical protein
MTYTTSNYNTLKVEEELTRKSLGHDIGELESGGHMKNMNFAQ